MEKSILETEVIPEMPSQSAIHISTKLVTYPDNKERAYLCQDDDVICFRVEDIPALREALAAFEEEAKK